MITTVGHVQLFIRLTRARRCGAMASSSTGGASGTDGHYILVMTTAPSFAARFELLADERGELPALTFNEEVLSFFELNQLANRMARHLLSLGVEPDDFVTIAEPNSVEFVTTVIACWKVGATPQPVSSRLPRLELEAIVELAEPAVVVGADVAGHQCLPVGFRPAHDLDDSPLADITASSWKAPTSGGSTGLPKLIVSGDPSIYGDSLAMLAAITGAGYDAVTVMPGPLYHNGPFIWTSLALLAGSHVVLLPRFEAEATLAAVHEHEARAIYLVPTMMQRIWKLPTEDRLSYDMSSLKVAFHLAEPCPQWLKKEWIDWLGPEVIWELYGGTEGQSFAVLNGIEWLEHPGSVGRPITGEMVIRDTDGSDLPSGEVGDVWMRWTGRDTPTYRYVGAEAEQDDGWECLGDIGWMDDDGYLYLADRRKDMILVGGANIYPAEVEAALNAHPSIQSAAVIGLPDEERGNTVHAIVEATEIDLDEVRTFLGDRLVSYKIPRTIEIVDEPLRDDAGKVRRGALRDARLPVSD